MRGLFDTPELGPCTVEPFPHQRRAIDAARERFRRGDRGTMVVHATGTGKALIIGFVGRATIEKGGRVLALAHTTELVSQLADTFDMVGVEPGVEQAEQFARQLFDPQAVVASVATMREPGRLMSYPEDFFDLICIDECHHSGSAGENSYKRIVARFPRARRLGLTATPKRGDDLGLGGMFDSVADTFSILDAWDAEKETGIQYLCDLVPIRLDVNIDLRKLRPGKHDFTDEDLDARVAPMIEVICNKSAEKIGDRQTVAFFPSIRSAQLYADGMRQLGFSADWVSGADPERDDKVERYRRGDIQVLANMNLLCEGFNVPRTSAVVLARPTKSWTLYLQQIGRATRRGKKDALLIDLNYLTDDFGLVQPADLVDVPGFDREIAEIAAGLVRATPGLSLRSAIEEAKAEFEDRVRRRQSAARIAIAERRIECDEESFSMKAMHHDGEVFTGRVVAPSMDFKPITEGQVRFLNALGVFGCEKWSRQRAGTVISYLKRQREAGKSSVRQRQTMIRQGVDAAEARDMTADQASKYLDQIDKFNERRRGQTR